MQFVSKVLLVQLPYLPHNSGVRTEGLLEFNVMYTITFYCDTLNEHKFYFKISIKEVFYVDFGLGIILHCFIHMIFVICHSVLFQF